MEVLCSRPGNTVHRADCVIANRVITLCILACRHEVPPTTYMRLEARGQGNGCFSPARHIHCWRPLHRLWSGLHRGQSAGPAADQMPRSTLQAQRQGCLTVWCLTQGAEWGLSDWHAPFPLHSPLQRLGAHGQHSCRWRSSDTPHNLEVRTGMRGGIVMLLIIMTFSKNWGIHGIWPRFCTPSHRGRGWTGDQMVRWG